MPQTPDQIAQSWVANTSNSRQKFIDGVNNVTVAPGQAAARQKMQYLTGVQQNVDKWAVKVSAVPLEEWKNKMTTLGADRIASGVGAAQPKFMNFMTQLLPFIANVKSSLPPRGTLDQNIARSTAMIRGMSNFKYNGR